METIILIGDYKKYSEYKAIRNIIGDYIKPKETIILIGDYTK